MLNIVPYELDDIKNSLKIKAIEEFGISDAEYEGSNISQLINLLAYSNVINNTNLSFGLNEMFISQAKDIRNVKKHAKQMGYNIKRNSSYQYKIKLKVKTAGAVTIEKYTTFTSNDNNYIYMDDSFTDIYGKYTYVNSIVNDNLGGGDLYNDPGYINVDDYLISETGLIVKILDKVKTDNRLLLEIVNDGELSVINPIFKSVYYWDGTFDSIGYKNLIKIGKIDTYLTDKTNEIFKIQITPDDFYNFPIFTENIITSTIIEGIEYNIEGFEKPIRNINYIKILGDNGNDIFINPNSIEIKDINITIDNINYFGPFQVSFPKEFIQISEEQSIVNDTITPFQTMEQDSLTAITYIINDVEYSIDTAEILVSITNNIITLPTEPNGLNWNDVERIYISYTYIEDLANKNVEVSYNYDSGSDGVLDKKFFFSDLRGNNIADEADWEGFTAYDYNSELNILYFDISNDSNLYGLPRQGEEQYNISEVFTTPYSKTLFSKTNRTEVGQTVEYDPFDIDKVFLRVNKIELKDELEIIVKEGNLLRWNDETEDSAAARLLDNSLPIIYENPDLVININDAMVDAGNFTIFKENVEDQGIEMFVTRILDTGLIEYDIPWMRQNYLLEERNDSNYIFSRGFFVSEDTNYEDYIHIYTSYANSGIPLSKDMIIRLNLLITNGKKGYTNDLIVPDNTDIFEATYYDEETLTNNLLLTFGSDREDIEDIKKNAPLYSNTANRAVTKNDYTTIANGEPYIATSQIWGGEDQLPLPTPGYIYASIIPYSRPTVFEKGDNSYSLKDADNLSILHPSYYQVTGKTNYYSEPDEMDKNVLFNVLNKYKIITLQLIYIKAIYLDYNLEIDVINYKPSLTIIESQSLLFNEIKRYFSENIELFDSEYYESSLIRYVDKVLGDDFGFNLTTRMSIDIYDNLYTSEDGLFRNYTLNDIDPYNEVGISGFNDVWIFEAYFSVEYDKLFRSNVLINGRIVERGEIIEENIMDFYTDNFIEYGDRLYLDRNIDNIGSYNLDEVLTYGKASSVSKRIIIDLKYKDVNNNVFKVGELIIYNNQKISYLTIFTHLSKNIKNLNFSLEDNFYGSDRENPIIPLDRNDFLTLRKMNVNITDGNNNATRSIFPRLRDINFV